MTVFENEIDFTDIETHGRDCQSAIPFIQQYLSIPFVTILPVENIVQSEKLLSDSQALFTQPMEAA